MTDPRPHVPPPIAADPRKVADDADRLAGRLAWIGAWLAGSVYLVAWAAEQGLASPDAFSVWALPGYAALALLVIVMLSQPMRALRRRRPDRLWPHGSRPALAATAMLVVYPVLALLWDTTAGPLSGAPDTLGVPTVWLATGIALLTVYPIVHAGTARGEGRGLGMLRLRGLVSVGAFGAALVLVVSSVLPILEPAGLRLEPEPETVLDPGSHLRIVAMDGSSDLRIPSGEAREPAWSPDGTRLVAVRWRAGPAKITSELVLMGADGWGSRTLTRDDEWKGQPVWSPDGTRIAYAVTTHGDTVAASAAPVGPDAAPDPTAVPISVFGGEGGDWDLAIVDVASGEVTTLVGGPSQEGRPAWSPDGSRIAFYSTRGGSFDIWVVDVATGALERLTDDPALDWGAAWSPDGDSIAFTSDRGGNAGIYVLDPADETRAVRLLTTDAAHEWWPAWSPDGTRLAYASDRSGRAELWVVDASGGEPRRLTNTADRFPELTAGGWSPDGSRIVYASREVFPGEADAPDARPTLLGFLLLGAIVGAVAILAAFVAGPTSWVGASGVLLLALVPEGLAVGRTEPILATVIAAVIAAVLTRVRRRGLGSTGIAAGAAGAWVLAYVVVVGADERFDWSAGMSSAAVALAIVGAATVAGLVGIVGRARLEVGDR